MYAFGEEVYKGLHGNEVAGATTLGVKDATLSAFGGVVKSLRLPAEVLPWIIYAAAASFLGNLFYVQGMAIAPNAGYVAAIEGCKGLVVTLAAIWLSLPTSTSGKDWACCFARSASA